MSITPVVAKKILKKAYFSRIRPNGMKPAVLLIGPPGIGKSTVVYEVARDIAQALKRKFIRYEEDKAEEILQNPDRYFVFVDLRLTEVEPSDLLGVPRDIGSWITYKPLRWVACLSKCPGILFLDELTNVQRDDVLAVSYKLILDRMAGFVPFSEGVMVVAAGNAPEHSMLARNLPAPLIGRVCILNISPPTVEQWIEWMDRTYGDAWCKRVGAYLMMNRGDLYTPPDSTETLEGYPSPRTWTMFASVLGNDYEMKFTPDEITTLAIGYLGKSVGARVAAFINKRLPTIDEVLKSPDILTKLDVDTKMAFTAVFGRWLAEDMGRLESQNVRKVISLLVSEKEEYLMLLCFMAGRKKYSLAVKISKMIPKVRMVFKKIEELKRMFEG